MSTKFLGRVHPTNATASSPCICHRPVALLVDHLDLLVPVPVRADDLGEALGRDADVFPANRYILILEVKSREFELPASVMRRRLRNIAVVR